MSDKLQQAMDAIEAGDKETGKQLLAQALASEARQQAEANKLIVADLEVAVADAEARMADLLARLNALQERLYAQIVASAKG